MATFPSPLYVICDAEVCERSGWSVPELASACLDGGASCLQIRAKQAASGWLLACADAVVARASSHAGATVIINDRADVARLSGASGVHVGQADLAPGAVRSLVGEEAVVGLSTHTDAQLALALSQPVSYVAVGPVFATGTKDTGYEAVGLARVRDAATAARARAIPVIAIGGITIERAPSVLEAGAAAVAVISDLFVGGDPSARVAAYLRLLSKV